MLQYQCYMANTLLRFELRIVGITEDSVVMLSAFLPGIWRVFRNLGGFSLQFMKLLKH